MTRRLLACGAAGALLLGTAESARAQYSYWPLASQLDVGVYAGGSVTTNWFRSRPVASPAENGGGEGLAPGYGPVFGAMASLWITPTLGVRLHGAYVPMQLPAPGGVFDFPEGRAAYEVNAWLYDVGLTLRPFMMDAGVGATLMSAYLFAGGGGMRVDLAGEDRDRCQRPYLLSLGACLSHRPSQATVGQVVVGAGIELLPVVENYTLFGELALHVYDSPVHVDDEWVGPITAPAGSTVRVADDAVAFTPRLVIGVKSRNGDLVPMGSPMPPPLPLPPAAPPPPPPPPSPRPPITARDIRVCVVQNGMAVEVTAQFDTATGDTSFGTPGWPVPPGDPYAVNAQWFVDNEPVTIGGRQYVKYGYPRVLGVDDVTRVAEYRGITVFAEAGGVRPPEVVYVPVRMGCEFQPYQISTKAGAVRGE
ncbi:MAG TPA: hypothetical protein VFR37_14380 [Longimicrobium sp.]|nr:hypothetical protein [Longimicrobium sp.]